MDKGKSATIKFFIALMDLCWLYILGALLSALTASGLLSLTWLILIYATAWLISALCRGRLLILGILAHGAALYILVRLIFSRAEQFTLSAVPDQLQSIWTNPEMLVLIHPYIVTMVALIFWAGGIIHSRRTTSTSFTAGRFDLGITILLVVTAAAGALNLSLSGHLLAITFFLLTGIIAIYLSRSGEPACFKNMVIPLVYTVLITVMAMVPLRIAFFSLASAADKGNSLLQWLFKPLALFLARVIIFLFRGRSIKADSSTGENISAIPGIDGESSGLFPWLGQLLLTLLLIILAAAILTAFIYGFILLIRYLTRKRISGEQVNLWLDMKIWLKIIIDRIKLRFTLLSKKIASLMAKDPTKIFKRYLKLGKWFGQSRRKEETIIEYSKRLKCIIPEYKTEISTISEGFNLCTYGNKQPDNKQWKLIKKASRRLLGIKSQFLIFSYWISGRPKTR